MVNDAVDDGRIRRETLESIIGVRYGSRFNSAEAYFDSNASGRCVLLAYKPTFEVSKDNAQNDNCFLVVADYGCSQGISGYPAREELCLKYIGTVFVDKQGWSREQSLSGIVKILEEKYFTIYQISRLFDFISLSNDKLYKEELINYSGA